MKGSYAGGTRRLAGRGTVTALALVLCCQAGAALAQATDSPVAAPAPAPGATAAKPATQAGPGQAGLEEIVVTARRVSENLQQIPISVGTLTPKALSTRNIAGFQDLKGSVAGLQTSRTGTVGGGYVTIRGLTPVASPQPASDQGVGFFIDGIYIARSQGSGAPLTDLARVEVLRGPQGTLFGRNSSVGTINFITNTPVDKLEANASIEGGNYGALRAEGTVNIPFFDGLIGRFSYRHEQIDGDVKNTSTAPGFNYAAPFGAFKTARSFDESRSNSYLARLRYTGITNLTIDYKYDREQLDQTPPSSQIIGFTPTSTLLPLLGGIYPIQAPGAVVQSFTRLSQVNEDHVGTGHVLNQGHMLNIGYEAADHLTLRSITGYRQTHSDNSSDLDGGAWTFPTGVIPGLGGPLCVSCSVNRIRQHAWSQEVQAIGKLGGLSYTLGGYYFEENARFANTYSLLASIPFAPAFYTPTTTTTVPPLGTPGDFVLGNNGIYNNRSYALYAHADYDLFTNFNLSAGVRYTWDRRSTDDLRPFGSGLSKYRDGRVTYDVAGTYHLDRTKLIYAKYSSGYTSGGVDSNIRFKPEVNDQVEIGAKTEFFDRKLRFNTALYYSWVKNRQTTLPNTDAGAGCNPALLAAGFTAGSCPVGLFVYNLPGTTTIKGLEVETVLAPVRGLTLSANFAYNDPKFTTGERPRSSKTNFSFSGTYDFPTFSDGSYIEFIANGDYRSKYYATGGTLDANFVGAVPAALRAGLTNGEYLAALQKAATSGDYWLVNLRVALTHIPLAGGELEIGGFIRNLTDTRKPYLTVNYGNTFNAAYERPRTYGVRAAVRF